MALAFETATQLGARVVEHLVHGAAARSQLASQDVDLHIVQHNGDEHPALPRREVLSDRATQGAEELYRLHPRLGRVRPNSEPVPGCVVVRGRDAAAMPCMPPELHRYLEDRKRVRPGRESAGTAVAVELAHHGENCIVGGLVAEIIEFGATDLWVAVVAAVSFGVGGSKEEVVEPFERLGAPGSCCSEAVDPRARFDVEMVCQPARLTLRSLRFHLREETILLGRRPRANESYAPR